MTERVPLKRLLLWALLIPVSYAPSHLIGDRPPVPTLLVGLAALALAGAALVLIARTRVLDRAAASLETRASHVLVVAIALYAIFAIAHAQAQLARFADLNQLGLFSQSFWTLLRGHAFANTHETLDGSLGSHFGVHCSPTLLMLTPVYALWPSPLVLMAAQALALALVPLPLYHLLKPRTGGAGALTLSLSVLALPNVLWAGFRDFRDSNFLPVLLLGALWALERRRLVPFLLLAIAALGVREDAGFAIVMLGVYALLRGHRWPVAAGIVALGVVWFAIAAGVVMPRFWTPGLWIEPKRFFASMLGHWGATPLEAARAMVSHPADLVRALASGENAHYLYTLVRPLLLLPPFGDLVAIVGLPTLGVNLLSRLEFMRGAYQAYALVPITFFAAATVLLAARLAGTAPEARRHGTALAAGLIVLAGVLPSLPLTAHQPEPPAPPAAPAAAIVRAIPPRVPVYAPVTLYPQLADREDFGCWWSTLAPGREPGFRGRYAWIVIWPAGDPSAHDSAGVSPDQPLADSLARDPRFVRRDGFEPFIVFRRR